MVLHKTTDRAVQTTDCAATQNSKQSYLKCTTHTATYVSHAMYSAAQFKLGRICM